MWNNKELIIICTFALFIISTLVIGLSSISNTYEHANAITPPGCEFMGKPRDVRVGFYKCGDQVIVKDIR